MPEEQFIQMYVRDFATMASRVEAGSDIEAQLNKRISETRSHAALMDARKAEGHLAAVIERQQIGEELLVDRVGADPVIGWPDRKTRPLGDGGGECRDHRGGSGRSLWYQLVHPDGSALDHRRGQDQCDLWPRRHLGGEWRSVTDPLHQQRGLGVGDIDPAFHHCQRDRRHGSDPDDRCAKRFPHHEWNLGSYPNGR